MSASSNPRQITVICANPALEVTYAGGCFSETVPYTGCCTLAAGGKGINVARILKKIGCRPFLVTCFGGAIGSIVSQRLLSENIVGSSIQVSRETRISTVVYSGDDENAFVMRSNGGPATSSERAELIEAALSSIGEQSIICLSGSIMEGFGDDLYGNLTEIARDRDCATILDAAGPALSQALRARPYLVKINREEALSLVEPANEDASPAALLANVLSKGAANAVITDGRRGWNACIEGRFLKCSIEPNLRGFDVGAGDAMLAGLARGLSNGLSMDDTLHFATRLAAASTFIRGAGDVLLEEVDRPHGCLIEDRMD